MRDMTLGQPIDTRREQGTPDSGQGIALRRRRLRLRGAAFAVIVAAAMGALAVIGWQRGLFGAHELAPGLFPAPAPSAPAAPAPGNLAATNAELTRASAQLAALEQRLAALDEKAASASGQATRAEALLVAFAARRAIERGQPLGYLETQLRVRFGEAQPTAVDTVIAAAQKPVTAASLAGELAALEPHLAGGPSNEGGWDWVARQFGELFIIRHDDMPSPAPRSRLDRARIALGAGRVDLAIAEVERLPGHDAANDWIVRARAWLLVEHALDQLESAALAQPDAHAVLPAAMAPPSAETPAASAGAPAAKAP